MGVGLIYALWFCGRFNLMPNATRPTSLAALEHNVDFLDRTQMSTLLSRSAYRWDVDSKLREH